MENIKIIAKKKTIRCTFLKKGKFYKSDTKGIIFKIDGIKHVFGFHKNMLFPDYYTITELSTGGAVYGSYHKEINDQILTFIREKYQDIHPEMMDTIFKKYRNYKRKSKIVNVKELKRIHANKTGK